MRNACWECQMLMETTGSGYVCYELSIHVLTKRGLAEDLIYHHRIKGYEQRKFTWINLKGRTERTEINRTKQQQQKKRENKKREKIKQNKAERKKR